MDGILYKDLMESYKQVHTPQEINEGMYDGEQLSEQGRKPLTQRQRIERDRRIQAAGGGAAGEEKEFERLQKANVRPTGSSGRRWRPRSEDELRRQAGYNVRQQGRKNLKNNPGYKPPEKTKPTETKPTETKPTETKTTETKTTQTQPTQTKPTQTQPTQTKPTQTQPAPKPTPKPTPKPQSKDMGDNYRRFAKANPNLAKKVKPGQAGFKAINPNAGKPSGFGSSSSKPSTPSKVSGIKSNRLASALSGVKKFKAEEFDTFDLIHEYLLESGFAYDEATQIMVEMGQAKIDEILNTISEEDYDRMKDRRMERGGSGDRRERPMSDGRGKKKGSGDAFDHVVSAMKKQYGDKAIMARKSRKES